VLAFGASLVPKTDNGNRLIDGQIHTFLQAHDITPLVSPACLDDQLKFTISGDYSPYLVARPRLYLIPQK
jgi:hypothetical protein